MNKVQGWLLVLGLCATGMAAADEGMWTFDEFPAARMRSSYGWAPDADWLKHVQLASIRLAQGCSASLVSPTGLVMTNHHCVRDCLNELADTTHDYIAHGFYAAQTNDEKRCPELEADQLVSIVDVTAAVGAATAGRSGSAFHDAERASKAKIESECGTAADVRCEVVTLYHGGVYDLYRYKRYQDVRVVFAPEESSAFFGGDPDNFTFPRFDLDCAFVRIYDGGKPLQTTTYLKFATRGVKEGDIAFVAGNPGSTEREDTLSQLEFQRDSVQPFVLNFLAELRGVLNEFATKGPDEDQASNSLRFSVENSLKAYKGMQLALVQGSIIANKERSEGEFRRRVAADASLAPSTAAWDAISTAVARDHVLYVRYRLLERYVQSLSPLMRHAISLNRYAAEIGKPDGQRLEEYSDAHFPALQQQIDSRAPVHEALEKTFIAWWLSKVREDLGTDDGDVKALMGTHSPEEIAAALVDGTGLKDAGTRGRLLAGGAAAIGASHDPLLEFVRKLDAPARAVRANYENDVKAPITQSAGTIAHARFVLDGRTVYPDATFTLRLSYGAVAGYEDNGHSVAPTTNFAGGYAHATGRPPFKLPQSWVTAEPSVTGSAPLDFVSTNDVIGGNSGSPVIGRQGEAIGVLFDGNIYMLGGNFGYDGSVNRSVAVEASGIREALKNIYHADRLLRELGS